MKTPMREKSEKIAERIYNAVDELNAALSQASDDGLSVKLEKLDARIIGDTVLRSIYSCSVQRIDTEIFARTDND